MNRLVTIKTNRDYGKVVKKYGKAGKIRVVQGECIGRNMDWLNLVLSMNEGDILFIDDIEKVNWSCDELICTSIEDNWVDIVLGKDFNCKVTRIWIPHFTLIGITKNLHKVSPIIYQRLKKGK